MTLYARKPDAVTIDQFVREMSPALGLGGGREHWPFYLFHTADIENTISILQHGALYCREVALESNLVRIDSAHRGVIDHTTSEMKRNARLYFRPRSPTTWHTEGFRPGNDSNLIRHGISVVFVFDSIDIMTRSSTLFTDGNAGSDRHRTGTDLAFLRTVPFDMVYHDGTIPAQNRDEIVFRRNAEVLVPTSLPLDSALRWIMVRSEAELETLLSRLRKLGPEAYARYQPKCRVNVITGTSSGLFHREWTYVEQVTLAEGKVTFRFSQGTRASGPFDISLKAFSDSDGSVIANLSRRSKVLNGAGIARLPEACANQAFALELRIDDRQAYLNFFTPEDAVLW